MTAAEQRVTSVPVPDDDNTTVLRRSGDGGKKFHRPGGDGTPICGTPAHRSDWQTTTLRQCVFYDPCRYCWEVSDE